MKKSAASPAFSVEGRQDGPVTHSLTGAADQGKGAGESRKAAIPGSVEQLAVAGIGDALQSATPAYLFGDVIMPPKKSRKSRAAYLKPERKFSRHQPIWQRIESEWKRYRCRKCKSVSFVIVEEEDLFVKVRCASGHDGKVLKGFAQSKPDG
jgi:hypothetical protein